MIRILTYAPISSDGTSFYRLSGVIPYLQKEYSDIFLRDISNRQDCDWTDYISYDIVIFQRPFIEPHLKMISMMKLMGIKVIIDYDDDILNIPMHNPFYISYNANKGNIENIIKIADEVWVSTPDLKKTVVELNKNVTVIPNAHNDYIFPVKNKKPFNNDTKKVAYRGGTTHEMDVYSRIDEWSSIVNKNKKTTFYFIGARFPYLESKCDDNYVIVPGSHILDYFRNIASLNPNIFIYTLEDTQFNKAKSNISWIEATYAGAAVLAPEYLSEFIRPGIISFNDSMEDIFNAVKKNYKLLEEMNEESWDYIQHKLLLSTVNAKRYESILEVQNRK
jgi:hypothetical protein